MSARRHRRQSGFSLVELLIAVMIIATLTSALQPGLRRTLLEQRLGAAARDFVSIIRRARQDAMTRGTAHLVLIDPAGVSVRMLRGVNQSCLAQDWAGIDTACTADNVGRAQGTTCAAMSFADPFYSFPLTTSVTLVEIPGTGVPTHDEVLKGAGVTTSRALCFTHTGTAYLGASAATLSTSNNVGGAIIYRIDMLRLGESDPDERKLPSRLVFVPLSGFAKVMR